MRLVAPEGVQDAGPSGRVAVVEGERHHPAGAAHAAPDAPAHRTVVAERPAGRHGDVAGLVTDRELDAVHAGHEALAVLVARRQHHAPRARRTLQPPPAHGEVAVLVRDPVGDLHGPALLVDREAADDRLDAPDDAGRHARPGEARRPRVDLHRHRLAGLLVQGVVHRVELDDVLAVVGVVPGSTHLDLGRRRAMCPRRRGRRSPRRPTGRRSRRTSRVAVSLRQREPMPLAVVTGAVTSPGDGVTVGTMVGSATGGSRRDRLGRRRRRGGHRRRTLIDARHREPDGDDAG